MKIQEGREIPDIRYGRTKYPWPDMEPGECLFIPEDDDLYEHKESIGNNARMWVSRNRPGWKAVTRTMDDGYRIWMVEDNEG